MLTGIMHAHSALHGNCIVLVKKNQRFVQGGVVYLPANTVSVCVLCTLAPSSSALLTNRECDYLLSTVSSVLSLILAIGVLSSSAAAQELSQGMIWD